MRGVHFVESKKWGIPEMGRESRIRRGQFRDLLSYEPKDH